MKKLMIIFCILLAGCLNPQENCLKNKERILSKIGANIYFLKHHSKDSNFLDSIKIRELERDYGVLSYKSCSQN